ncbi:MAG: DUF5362 family protein [Sphingobacteriaceae bacterium]
MESFELSKGTDSTEPAIILTDEAKYYLYESGRWAVFLGIIGFVFCGLLVIISIFMKSLLHTASSFSQSPNPMAAMGSAVTIVYIMMAIMYFFPSLFLYQFGSKIKRGLNFDSQLTVNEALGQLKSYFKFWGIFTIVIIALYALALVGILVGGGLGAASMMSS